MTINEILDLAITQGLLTEERRMLLISLQDVAKGIIEGEGSDTEKAANLIGVGEQVVLQLIQDNS